VTLGRFVPAADFPASQKWTYLNAASVALMSAPAAEATIAWQRDLAENGTRNFDEVAEETVFDDLRAASARLLNARDEDIAVGSSATDLLSSLAWALLPQPDQVIVGTEAAFPSAIYPWQRIARHTGCVVRLARADDRGLVDADELLGLIDERTAIVALSHVEYRTGQVYDLAALAHKVHEHGGLLVVDATQSVGQVPIDVKESGVDVLVSAGYKWLCGPFGAAIMYLAPGLQHDLDPGTVGWRSHKKIWSLQADRCEFPNGARRFEASTMAYGCAVGLARAVAYLNEVGIDRIYAHNLALVDRLASELRAKGGRVQLPEDQAGRSSILSVSFPGHDPTEIAARLSEAEVIVSVRDSLRVSPHLYNDRGDIDRIVQVLDQVLS
jgi:selenocysteine lyase/cysteine desulfurase